MSLASWTCPFCGRGCGSGRSLGVHKIRCTKNPDRKAWSRAGVKNGQPRIRRASNRLDGEPSSACCGAAVTTGKTHDHGNRYCSKCGKGCYWYANRPLAVSWACRTNGCKSQVPGSGGYCFGCNIKRNKRKGLDEGEDADMI